MLPSPPPQQHNAAFALYGLSDNEDNLLEFVREGAVQRINECELVVQASRDCVNKLMKRLQVGRVTGQVERWGRDRQLNQMGFWDRGGGGTGSRMLLFHEHEFSELQPGR